MSTDAAHHCCYTQSLLAAHDNHWQVFESCRPSSSLQGSYAASGLSIRSTGVVLLEKMPYSSLGEHTSILSVPIRRVGGPESTEAAIHSATAAENPTIDTDREPHVGLAGLDRHDHRAQRRTAQFRHVVLATCFSPPADATTPMSAKETRHRRARPSRLPMQEQRRDRCACRTWSRCLASRPEKGGGGGGGGSASNSPRASQAAVGGCLPFRSVQGEADGLRAVVIGAKQVRD